MDTRQDLQRRIIALIDRLSEGGRDDEARDALLAEVREYQAQQVPAYGRWLAQAGVKHAALPTDVFRYARVCGHDAEHDMAVFRTSGTSQGLRGQCFLRDLSLYDRAAHAAARYALFPDVPRMRLLILAPKASEAADSSLSYMLQRFVEWFGASRSTHAWADGQVDVLRLREILEQAQDEGEPVALLGTSFAFVLADEALGEQRFLLPARSRIMQTGGFKGRTRELSPVDMDKLLTQRYGVPADHITQEYGMTEMSSQLYGAGLRPALTESETSTVGFHNRNYTLWVPGWVCVQAVDPLTLEPMEAGQVGILRLDDLANLDTVSALQTADLARVTTAGVQLLGRSPHAVPRGCSLAVEEAYEIAIGERR